MPRAQADSAGRAPGTLLESLRDRIRREGPMPLDRYMQACLDDPVHGYRLKPEMIGAAGDFVTAPEIAQVFGELIGIWCAAAWEGMGRPAPLRLVELGPGRGTLMRDALRAARVLRAFLDAATVHLVEISQPLRRLQRELLAPREERGKKAPSIAWHERLEDVPAGAAIVVGNEFLDALPIRQLVYGDGTWHERVVEAAPAGGLRFAIGPEVAGGIVGYRRRRPASDETTPPPQPRPDSPPPMPEACLRHDGEGLGVGGTTTSEVWDSPPPCPSPTRGEGTLRLAPHSLSSASLLVPHTGGPPRPGAIVELRAGEDELLAALAARASPVLALFIDYGPADRPFGDTLQAVRRHGYADPLADPGTADLTAHVQFATLADKASAAGLAVAGPIAQAEFLGRLGIAERTARLMAANPRRAGKIEAATQRLMSPTGMGQLFKAIAVHSPGMPPPPAFE